MGVDAALWVMAGAAVVAAGAGTGFAAGEFVAPWVYIESNTGTVQYMTVEVFRLNNK